MPLVNKKRIEKNKLVPEKMVELIGLLKNEPFVKGDKGDKGEDGKDGLNGLNGKDGAQGPAGRDGKNGLDGKNGKDGQKGEKGDKGEDGKSAEVDAKDLIKLINSQKGGIVFSALSQEVKDWINERIPKNMIGAPRIKMLNNGTEMPTPLGSLNIKGSGYTLTNTGQDYTLELLGSGISSVITNASMIGDGTSLSPLGLNLDHENTWNVGQVFNDPDIVKTPIAPASSNISFVLDPSGFLASGTYYQFYIYSYWYTGSTYAYDPIGIFTANTDPNDAQNYNLDISWSAGTDSNGYLIYNFINGDWIDLGNTTSVTITPSTAWNGGGSFPTLSPNSLSEPGHPLWANKTQDWGTTDFNVMAMGLSGSNHLQLRWLYFGGTGAGALRFESDDGLLRTINANIYAENISVTNTLNGGNISGYIYPTTFGATHIAYGASGGYITGGSMFTFDQSTTRMLLSNAGITPRSQLHMNYSTATAVNIQFTNSSTGTAAGDGTLVGITSTGVFEINQRENLAINIYTLGTLRATYAASASPRYTVFGGIEAQYNAIANTSTDGLFVSNLTSATAGVPIQRPGRIRMSGYVWDTGVAATRFQDWIIDPVYTSGNPGSQVIAFGSQYNAGGYTYHMNLSSTGRLHIGNGVVVGSANLHVTSASAEIARIQRTSSNNAAFGFVNSSGSMFVGLVSGGNAISIGSTADVTADTRFAVTSAGAIYSAITNGYLSVGTTGRLGGGFGKMNLAGTDNSTNSPVFVIQNTSDTSTGKNGGIWGKTRMTSRYLQTIQNLGFNDNSFGNPGVIQWTAWEYSDNTYATLATPTEFTGWSYQYYNGSTYVNLLRIHTSGVFVGSPSTSTTPATVFQVNNRTIAAGSPGTLATITIGRAINSGVSYPQAASFNLGTYSTNSVSNGYGPDTRLDLALKSTSTDSYTTDVNVMTWLDTGAVGVGETAPGAFIDIKASTTSLPHLRLRSGSAPTTPNDGDIWFDGTDIKMRVAGVTKTFTLV